MIDSLHEDIDAMSLLEAMTESVLVTTTGLDRPGPSIVYVNPAFERMTGWSKQEIMGRSPRILQGRKTDHSVFRDLRERLIQGKHWSGQTINYRKNGTEFVMAWSIVPIRDKSGDVYRYLAVQRDITKRVSMEHELAAALSEERKWFRQLEETNRKLNELNMIQLSTLNLFTKYVPEAVVKKGLAAHGGSLFHGEKLEIVALFCDMRGFTSISEQLSPDRVVKMLNTYYTMMVEVINAHEGTVVQFVGDEIFAIFGAPMPIRDCVENALRCALAMVERLKDINTTMTDVIGQDICVGIGLNYGPVIAGNLGSEERISYSITGDTVNTAKRIESLAKDERNTILIGESIYKHACHLVTTQALPAMLMKGKKAEINVFEVLGLRGDSPEK
ncbi:MAG: PAS domain S-box protein [Desulfosarcina sp.]|nr:PAS domain S-box protein [Desulfosarcina sp.]